MVKRKLTQPILLIEDERRCGGCGRIVNINDCGDAGACPGSIFCVHCNVEIDVHTGQQTAACGTCEHCLTNVSIMNTGREY